MNCNKYSTCHVNSGIRGLLLFHKLLKIKHMKGILKMKGLLTLFCCYLFLGNVVISWAEGNPPKQENIPLEGKWDEIKRSVTVEYPVRAYYDALNLYIGTVV